MELKRRDMKGLEALSLKLVVVYNGALFGHDFGHHIGEINLAIQSPVAFDNLGIASGTRHDQISWMGHAGRAIGCGKVEKVDGIVNDTTRR